MKNNILSGAEFKDLALANSWTLVKYLNSNDFTKPQEKHHNYHYQLGLNIIPKNKVNLDLENQCSAGGLYFTYLESAKWINYHWFIVTVPDDAQVLIESREKFKTDKLILLNEIEQISYLCLEAVKRNPTTLYYVKEQTLEICLKAVKRDPETLCYVKEQTQEICLEAVKRDAMALQHVKEQTREICLEAVRRFGPALQHVEEQTREICLEAVKEAGWALQYVKEQTPEICETAIKEFYPSMRYVKKKTLVLRLVYLKSILSYNFFN